MATSGRRLKIKLTVSSSPPESSSDPFSLRLQPYRSKVIEQLGSSDLNDDLVNQFEKSCYDKSLVDAERLKCSRNFDQYKNLYMGICRHIIANLKEDNTINNVKFIEMVNSGQITPEEAIELSPQEMHTDRWRVLLERKQVDLDKLIKDPESTTDMFRCGKCRRNKCKYFERQDRSADEPMTLHITCCYCGNYWKQ
jgi:DNA-directed RNA polymerase subunit M/transcription elongation factor TFIIS